MYIDFGLLFNHDQFSLALLFLHDSCRRRRVFQGVVNSTDGTYYDVAVAADDVDVVVVVAPAAAAAADDDDYDDYDEDKDVFFLCSWCL